MSFFNLRRGGSSSKSQPGAPAESLDIIRKRAKHRLIGAAVLVLIGVVGFPLLFDSQPRPVPVDIAIEIPAKQSVKPLAASSTPSTPAAPAAVAPATPVAAVAPVPPVPPVPPATRAPAVAAPATPAPLAVPAPAAAAQAAADDSARAKALLEDKPVNPESAGGQRLVVQVGAFADAAKAREVRLKLEKAGLKTYTQVADSKEGKRTRVRIGPFASPEEAEQAAAKVKALGLTVTVLSL